MDQGGTWSDADVTINVSDDSAPIPVISMNGMVLQIIFDFDWTDNPIQCRKNH